MRNKMLLAMFLCTALGIGCGFIFPEKMLSLRWLDSLFIDLIKLVVIPLIFFSIVSSIITMGSVKRFKSIGFHLICYMVFSAFTAAIIGIVLSNLLHPGANISNHFVILQPRPAHIGSETLAVIFNFIFPPVILAAVKAFEITPLVIFSVVFASAGLFVGKSAEPVIPFFVGMRNIFNVIILWITYITPFTLFILLGSTIAEAYTQNALIQSITSVFLFICAFILGLFLQFLWQLVLVLYLLKKTRKKFFLTAAKALLTAFATGSPLDSLPISLSVAKEQYIEDDVANFVLPFASTFNLAGAAMYEAVATLFFCQVLNIELSVATQIGIFLIAIITGIGSDNIPDGGLIKMTMILRSFHMPSSAIALLVPFDRLLDRLRAVVNVWGDLVCMVLVNHLATKKLVSNKQVASSVKINHAITRRRKPHVNLKHHLKKPANTHSAHTI